MKTKKLSYVHVIYILFAVFYLWLAAQIPYTHDDWDWGLEIGMQQWLTASVNSRYVGNFFEIIMTRSVFLKTIIMGGTFFLLPYLLSYIASEKNHKNTQLLLFLLANFLILTMSRMVWSETYGWVAGFANFVLSSVFTLLCLTQWLPLCKQEYAPPTAGFAFDCLWMLIAFLGQLFIENLSIVMAAVSIFVCITSYVRIKKIPLRYIFMCIGTVLGLCVMFSSSVYDSLFGSGEAVSGLRQLIISAEGGITTKVFNIFVQAARLATRAGEANFVLCIFVLIVLTYKLLPISKKRFVRVIIGINFLFAIYFTVNFVLQTDYTPDRVLLSAFAATVNALYFLLMAVEVIVIYGGDPEMQRKLIAVWFIGLALLAPLLVTNEAGYRLIFSLNIFVILFILLIMQEVSGASSNQNSIELTFFAATAIPVIVCAVVYSSIGRCNQLRLEMIELAAFNNAAEISLPAYPYANYLHAPDPIDEIRWGFYKEFYGIAPHTTVIIEDTD